MLIVLLILLLLEQNDLKWKLLLIDAGTKGQQVCNPQSYKFIFQCSRQSFLFSVF